MKYDNFLQSDDGTELLSLEDLKSNYLKELKERKLNKSDFQDIVLIENHRNICSKYKKKAIPGYYEYYKKVVEPYITFLVVTKNKRYFPIVEHPRKYALMHFPEKKEYELVFPLTGEWKPINPPQKPEMERRGGGLFMVNKVEKRYYPILPSKHKINERFIDTWKSFSRVQEMRDFLDYQLSVYENRKVRIDEIKDLLFENRKSIDKEILELFHDLLKRASEDMVNNEAITEPIEDRRIKTKFTPEDLEKFFLKTDFIKYVEPNKVSVFLQNAFVGYPSKDSEPISNEKIYFSCPNVTIYNFFNTIHSRFRTKFIGKFKKADLANFLKSHFEGFESNKIESMTKELSRDSKREKIDISHIKLD